MYDVCCAILSTDVFLRLVDLSAPALLHVSQRAAMDRAYSIHGSHLLVRLVAVSHVLQQRQLLRLFQHRS